MRRVFAEIGEARGKKILIVVPSVAGDITQKGFEKKRTRLLSPYVQKQNASKYNGLLFSFSCIAFKLMSTYCKLLPCCANEISYSFNSFPSNTPTFTLKKNVTYCKSIFFNNKRNK